MYFLSAMRRERAADVREVFRRAGGLLRTSQALRAGVHPRDLYELRDRGGLEVVSRGVYRLADLPALREPDLAAVAARVPRAVIAVVSALHFHGLTTEIPHDVSIALPKGTSRPRLDWPPLRVYWFSGSLYTEGIETHERDGVRIMVYSAARTVADCFRLEESPRRRGGDRGAAHGTRGAEVHPCRGPSRREEMPHCRGDASLSRGHRLTPPATDALAQSIQARLKNEARATDRPFAELVELYAVERLLHRLGRCRHRERFVLKGALLLRAWLGVDARPTRDIDLLGPADLDEEGLREAIADVLAAPVEDDAITFDHTSIAMRPIRVGSAVLGLRAKFDALLGRIRLRYQVDVGLGDAIYPPEVELVPGGLLGLPVASVRAYTPYTAVAEKLEAIVVLGHANSRTKDYYDLFQLPRMLAFDGPVIVESVRRTFERRQCRIDAVPPEGLSDEFAEASLNARRWSAFLAKARLRDATADFRAVVAEIRGFAAPVLSAARDGLGFDQDWPAGGPWR